MEALISRLISMGLFKYLGVGAIGMLIWYTGPYISFLKPVMVRLIAIAVVVVLYAAYLLVRKLIARRKDARLSDDLAANAQTEESSASKRSAEDVAELKKKFDEALEVLRKSGKGKKKGSLYSLPWYMIIGPPGAGKTTLLVNSGLRFPLAEKMGQSKLHGVGGTRFCDWWFTDEAVIIDTAGRYTTQDSDQTVDNAAWLGFLKLLKKNRKRRPISGIVVAVSIDDLARQTEVDRERTEVAVSARIQELYEQFGIRLPIYMMFTKSDLMAGFMEFFGDLNRHEREQVWGTTFEVGADPIAVLEQELELLQEQLEARLVQRLQQERDPQRRNLIYNFPALFNSAKPLVSEFVERVFKPSRYTTTPFLRGVYFTSATQEGTPFNRLISQLARGFRLSHANVFTGTASGKAYFIKDLLSSVIFGESGLAGTNLKADRAMRTIRVAGLVALTVLPLLLLGVWWISSSANLARMQDLGSQADQVREEIQQVSPQNSSMISVLPVLNGLRALPFGYQEQNESVPLKYRFGLYQGGRLSRNLTNPAYKHGLENAFLSRLMVRLEQQLRENLGSPETAYQALKVYLMLSDDERLDPDYVRHWVLSDWQTNLGDGLQREQYLQLAEHLDALLDLRPFATPFPRDDNLVERVRGALEQTSHAERAYAMIKAELIAEGDDFSLAADAGPNARQVLIRVSGEPFSTGVPAMYSPDGYYRSFIPTQARIIGEQEEEFWVFGTEAQASGSSSKAELTNQVSSLYFRDYIDQWWQFLGDVRIRPFSNHSEAAQTLQLLTAGDSPLVLLLKGAAERTRLLPDLPVGAEASEAGAVVQTVGDPAMVDREFKSLHDFVNGRGDQPAPLNGVKQDIEELSYLIATLARSGMGPETEGTQRQLADAVNRIRFSAGGAPKPMDSWIRDVADQTNGLVAGRTMGALNARWRSEVLPFCQKAIADRYPFAVDSEQEVSLNDFGQFFGPEGIMDRFFSAHLAPHVDTTTNPWRIRKGAADIVRVSEAALRQIRLAREIQQAFFSQGGRLPAASFDLTPVRMDAQTTHFSLNMYGRRISYSHDAPATETFAWPASSTFSQVQIQFEPPTSAGGSRTEFGDWAWFRFLDGSSPQQGNSPEEFRITLALGDRWIIYSMRARSAYNPFNLSQIHSFRCVPNL